LAAIKVGEDEFDLFIRRSLAVELYREGKLSLGKAAEVAGVRNKWEMLMLLNEKGVPIDYTAEDAEKDLKTLKEEAVGEAINLGSGKEHGVIDMAHN